MGASVDLYAPSKRLLDNANESTHCTERDCEWYPPSQNSDEAKVRLLSNIVLKSYARLIVGRQDPS